MAFPCPMDSDPKFLLLQDVRDLDKRDSGYAMDWAIFQCTSTNAVDKCDEPLAKAVTLLVHVGGPLPVAEFGICLNRELYPIEVDEANRNPIAYIEAADDRILVLSERFRAREDSKRLLVYDAAYTSLDVVPRLSRWYCTPSLTPHSFPLRSRDGRFALAIMVRCHMYDKKLGREVGQDALCLWPPPPSSKPHPQGSIEPWQLKQPVFPPGKPGQLLANKTFSFQGRAFWVDLGQGILSCNCEDVLTGGYSVQFRYTELPPECLLSRDCQNKGSMDLSWSRAMTCCSRDECIKLVCIGKGCDCKECGGREEPGDMVVTVWVLDLSTWQWCRDITCNELYVSSLWDMAGFKQAGLPEVEPILPVLSTQNDGDCILHFKLKKDRQGLVHLCGLNLCTKTMLRSCVLSQLPSHPPLLASDFIETHNKGCFLFPDDTDDAWMFPVSPKMCCVKKEQEACLPSVHPLKRTLPVPNTLC